MVKRASKQQVQAAAGVAAPVQVIAALAGDLRRMAALLDRARSVDERGEPDAALAADVRAAAAGLAAYLDLLALLRRARPAGLRFEQFERGVKHLAKRFEKLAAAVEAGPAGDGRLFVELRRATAQYLDTAERAAVLTRQMTALAREAGVQ